MKAASPSEREATRWGRPPQTSPPAIPLTSAVPAEDVGDRCHGKTPLERCPALTCPCDPRWLQLWSNIVCLSRALCANITFVCVLPKGDVYEECWIPALCTEQPSLPLWTSLRTLRSNLRAVHCRGMAGVSAGPSPKTVRYQSQQLLGQYTVVCEIARVFPAFKLGGGKGWQVLHLQWLLYYTRLRSKG